ncbi:MAG TPA: OmpA family protein [Terriglobales bacterium]|nr:OmpA family protein [Terriglobales bacterium]
MNYQSKWFKSFLVVLGTATLVSSLSLTVHAQEPKAGKLKVYVTLPEAYTFVDEKAIGPGNQSLRLGEGKHTLSVENYGFKPFRQDVSIASGETTKVKVDLEADTAKVSGPWGRIQIEVGTLTRGDYAVLLNGKSEGYFVGHVDEFNQNILWKQELIVPVRTHDITVTRNGQTVWSGSVPVAANQRVIINIDNGKIRTVDWPRGGELGEMPRFKARLASASVVIAPVSGSITATPTRIDCNQQSELKWASLETVDSDISGMSPVPQSGERQVSPKKTTSYELTASGPGGVVKSSATVDVNPVVVAQIQASPSEAKYRRIGDKVLTQENGTVNWSTSNVNSVSVDPFGSVDANGSRTVPLVPTQTTDGPVDQTLTYSLNATNVCGGSETKTVSIHLTGSVEGIPAVLLNSIFFPSDYPGQKDPTVGLLKSQQDALTTLANGFTKYLEYDPDAKLAVAAYADQRGPQKYNESLSERRGQSVKDFLVAKGISADKIDVAAYGEDKPLDQSTVDQLQVSNPNPPPEAHLKNAHTSWLAYNRRVDILFLPSNKESEKYYPNNTPDLNILWQRAKPDRSAVEQDE